MVRALFFCLLSMWTMSVASNGSDSLADKKLIEYGWDVPDTAFVRTNASQMEKVPFDGVVIMVRGRSVGEAKGPVLGWETFSKRRFKPEDYEHAITDLQAVKFKRFTDNFIQVIAYPGDVDWFDPEWDTAAHNAACLARVAKQTGCRGIMFDPEMYSAYPIWNYTKLTAELKAAHSFEDYTARVKDCGREFIRAINREYPDITILTLYGHSLPYMQSLQAGGLRAADYSLLAAFYDGVVEAATPGTILVDGYESSYGYGDRALFEDARKTVLERSKTIATSPKSFARHVRCGFGIWMDFDWRNLGWDAKDLSKNFWNPQSLRSALNYALEISDGYVWVYTETPKWWEFNVPEAYIQALALAKKGPDPVVKSRPAFVQVIRAEAQKGYSDEETFASLKKDMTEIFDFPKNGWKFNRDANDSGQKAKWYSTDFNDSTWRDISIGKFWEEQGETYDGIAWYRLRFKAPAVEAGKRVYLVIGAVDESAWVWLNGKSVGSHDIGPTGWDVPFALDVTDTFEPAQDNLLAVKVLDRIQAGGIWKSVKLMVK